MNKLTVTTHGAQRACERILGLKAPHNEAALKNGVKAINTYFQWYPLKGYWYSEEFDMKLILGDEDIVITLLNVVHYENKYEGLTALKERRNGKVKS